MTKTNFIVLSLIVSIFTLSTKLANADTVTLDALPGIYPGLGGGEFTAFTDPSTFNQYYASQALYNNGTPINGTSVGFETFCIETGVDFTPGNWGGPTYSYTLGQVAQPIPAAGAGSAIALTKGAAWLYFEFAKGILSGFDYTYGAGRMTDDNLLQSALWTFQGNQTYGSYVPATALNNTFYADALNAFGNSSAAADAGYTGSSVQILSLWDNSDNAAQNQLVLTGDTNPTPTPSVPDGGSTAALLGGALLGLKLILGKKQAS